MTKTILSFSKLLIINILLIFSPEILRGQNPADSPNNLVINPSFEIRALRPNIPNQTISEVDTVSEFLGWYVPTRIPSEIYTTDKQSGFIVDYDRSLIRDFRAKTGQNVAKIEVCCTEYIPKRDIHRVKRSYVEGELKEPLEVGKKYHVGFWLHFHCLSVTGVGMSFAFHENIKDTGSTRLKLKPVLYQKQLFDYNPKQWWLLVSDSIIAEQPYQNFCIGNFFPDDSTGTSHSPNFKHYLAFIDDVFVIKSNDAKMPPPKPVPPPKPQPKPVSPPPLPKVLNQVQFEYNSAQIIASSFTQLDSAVLTLQRFPKLKVLIKGHTSGEGKAEYNQKLSENRAEAVRDYLVSKGIAADRLHTKGFGSTQPLTIENSEADRQLNRRIEFEVLKE